MASTKALPAKENDFLRGLVQKVLDASDTQIRAAERLGVSQSYLNEFLGGTRGAGPKLLRGLARLHPRLAPRLLGLADGGDGGAANGDPRTADEQAIDEEFTRGLPAGEREDLVEAVQYASQRGPKFFRRTWWRLLQQGREVYEGGGFGDPVRLGERLLSRARAEKLEERGQDRLGERVLTDLDARQDAPHEKKPRRGAARADATRKKARPR